MVFRSLFGQPAIPQVGPDEAKQRQADGAVIVDVRELNEWHEGHIPAAVHIPLGQLGQRIGQFETSRELVIVCRSGNRSAAATKALVQAGYSNVANLKGGMIAWASRRLPVTHGR